MGRFNFDKLVSRSHLKASGWSLAAWEQENPFGCHCFYVCDYRHDGEPLLITVPQKAFHELPKTDFTAEDLCDGVLSFAAKLRRQPASASLENKTALVVSLYARKTRSYQVWLDHDPSDTVRRLHMILNLYPNPEGSGGVVRPFVGASQDTILDCDYVRNASEYVRLQDIQSGLFPASSAGPAASF